MDGHGESPAGVFDALDDSKVTRFQWKIMFVSGMGFFTDAYDLFVIGIVVVLIKPEWGLSTSQVSLLNSVTQGRLGGRRHRLRPDRRHPRPEEDLRLRGAHPGHRRARLRLRAELLVPADLPRHPRRGHRRRLPGLGHDHERVLRQAVPGPDDRPGLRHAGGRPAGRPAAGRRAAGLRAGRRHHLADPARLRRPAGHGRLLPAAADPRDTPVRAGGRGSRRGRGRHRRRDRGRSGRDPGPGRRHRPGEGVRRPSAAGGAGGLPDTAPKPAHVVLAAGDRRHLGPAGLLLLRQQHLHARDPGPAEPGRLAPAQHPGAARHLRRLRRARLHRRDPAAGPDRP